MERLIWFLNGYIVGLSEDTSDYITFMDEFYSFIRKKTKWYISPRGLVYELETNTDSPASAVKEFYRLLHAFHDDFFGVLGDSPKNNSTYDQN